MAYKTKKENKIKNFTTKELRVSVCGVKHFVTSFLIKTKDHKINPTKYCHPILISLIFCKVLLNFLTVV